jgi:exopolysaccharide production protein ExoQ
MPHIFGITFYYCVMGALFWFERNRNIRTSRELWIPTIWLLIIGSRPVSLWIGMAPEASPDALVEGSPVDRIIYFALILAGLVILLRRSARVEQILRANWPVVLYFSYCAASIMWSDFPDVSFKRWTKAIGDVVMVLIVLSERNVGYAVKRLLTRVGFVLMPMSVMLCKYYPQYGRSLVRWVWQNSYTGVTMGKNLLGMICMIYGIGTVWRLITVYREPRSRYRKRELWVHGVMLFLVIWLLSMAKSMTSNSCLAIGAALLLLASSKRFGRRNQVIHAVVFVMIFAVFSTLFLGASSTVLQSMGKDPTLTGRTEIWSILFRHTANRLIGAGYETFWLGPRLEAIWREFVGLQINEAHNGYIEVYLQLGILGITLLGLVIVTGYQRVFAGLRRDPELGKLRLAFFVVGVIYSMTEAGFRMMTTMWFFFLLSIMMIPIRSGEPLPSQQTHADLDALAPEKVTVEAL